MIDICCLQEVRIRGLGVRMLEMKGGRKEMIWKSKWSWLCGSYGEGGVV